jgi:hypothetical protein
MQEWIAQKGAEVLTRVAADGWRLFRGHQSAVLNMTRQTAAASQRTSFWALVAGLPTSASNKQFTVLPSVSAGIQPHAHRLCLTCRQLRSGHQATMDTYVHWVCRRAQASPTPVMLHLRTNQAFRTEWQVSQRLHTHHDGRV